MIPLLSYAIGRSPNGSLLNCVFSCREEAFVKHFLVHLDEYNIPYECNIEMSDRIVLKINYGAPEKLCVHQCVQGLVDSQNRLEPICNESYPYWKDIQSSCYKVKYSKNSNNDIVFDVPIKSPCLECFHLRTRLQECKIKIESCKKQSFRYDNHGRLLIISDEIVRGNIENHYMHHTNVQLNWPIQYSALLTHGCVEAGTMVESRFLLPLEPVSAHVVQTVAKPIEFAVVLMKKE